VRSTVLIAASAMLLVAASLWWIARDAPRALPAAEEAAGVGPARHEERGEAQPKLSSPKPAPPDPRGSQALRESEAPEAEVARSNSARTDSAQRDSAPTGGAPFEPQDSSSWPRAVNAPDRGTSEKGGEEGRENAEQDDFGSFRQRVDSLRAIFTENAGGEPIDPDSAGLSQDDVDRLDLDRDRFISSWELEKARQLAERAEDHPVRSDRGDGEYPIERGEYSRRGWEFDAIDTNRDDLVDVDEYYSFLFDTATLTLLLDEDGDRQISNYESRLPEDEFRALDVDESGLLKGWEMRRAVALGALDRDSVAR